MMKKCLMVGLVALFILSVLTSGSVMAGQGEPYCNGLLDGDPPPGFGPYYIYMDGGDAGPEEGGQVQALPQKPE